MLEEAVLVLVNLVLVGVVSAVIIIIVVLVSGIRRMTWKYCNHNLAAADSPPEAHSRRIY